MSEQPLSTGMSDGVAWESAFLQDVDRNWGIPHPVGHRDTDILCLDFLMFSAPVPSKTVLGHSQTHTVINVHKTQELAYGPMVWEWNVQ